MNFLHERLVMLRMACTVCDHTIEEQFVTLLIGVTEATEKSE